MPAGVLSSFIVYVLINAFTPGPGNILALNTVTNYGWKRGKPLFFGIFAGYYAVQLLCAIFVFMAGAYLPGAVYAMKYIGAAYILWLAIHVALDKPTLEDGVESASFAKGFILQFANIKIFMFGITALSGFVVPYSASLTTLVMTEIMIATVGTIATISWIGMGTLIQEFYLKHYRIINAVLALTLLECIWSILKT